MTDDDVVAWEGRVKRALHKTEVAVKALHSLLAELRDDVANDRGMDVTVMSGGDDKPPQDPPPGP